MPDPAPSASPHPRGDWRSELALAYRDVASLLADLDIPVADIPWLEASDFPLRVPRGYVRRMRRSDPHDPLLRQVLPLAQEAHITAGFLRDPVGDSQALAAPGLLHKYRGRVLLMLTGACAVHCRYCFRRHFPYSDAGSRPAVWEEALDYLAAEESITEVILSGGDPLTLPDGRLAALARRLDAIPQLRRLRIHSRLPVVLPERVDTALLEWLGGTRLQTVVVIHANHGNEIDGQVKAALARLAGAGATLLNQAVLLRGVNDNAAVLAALSEKLFAAGVLPYYLHLLDRVQGAAHFEVAEDRALAIHRELLEYLPGYLVPRLVREEAGAAYKLPYLGPTPQPSHLTHTSSD